MDTVEAAIVEQKYSGFRNASLTLIDLGDRMITDKTTISKYTEV